MARVKIFSTGTCPICENTKNLLTKWKIPYDEIRVDQSKDGLKEMLEKTQGARTVPQILIDAKWIGGFTELTELHMEGKLQELLD
jgi:glutaredoxin 3